MAGSNNLEVITFKADMSLKKLLTGVSNRSEFIRNAVLAALDSACPFCKGTGVLNDHRKKHWNELVESHDLKECNECHEIVVGDCDQHKSKNVH